jgi:hypothetical protein
MQKYLLWSGGFMMIVLLNTPAICSAEPRIRPSHTASGTYQGKSLQQGNTTKYYNKQGSIAGRSVRQGKRVKNYDKSANMVGKSAQQGNTTKVYGRSRQNGWKTN